MTISFFILSLLLILAQGPLAILHKGPAYDTICPSSHADYAEHLPLLHGISMIGSCKYGPSFTHFSCLNPHAPKGGQVTLAHTGSSKGPGVTGTAFSSLNPYCPGQDCPPFLNTFVFDPLMRRSPHEPFALYGLIAQFIRMPKDRSFLVIHLNPQAKFQTGDFITAEDVLFTYELLSQKGFPGRRLIAEKVKNVKILDPHTLRFDFLASPEGSYDRELPLLVLLMPVLCKKDLSHRDFEKTRMIPLVSNGPYKIQNVDQGKRITYQRDPHYWAKDLPVNKGLYNIDTITVDIYTNEMSAFEAFSLGHVSLWEEKNDVRWQKGYAFPAAKHICKVEITHGQPVGMNGFALNQFHKALQDKRVRQALMMSVNYDHMRPQMSPSHQFTESFFQGTAFQALKEPGASEQKILAMMPHPLIQKELPSCYRIWPEKARLEKALSLLKEAGWNYKKGYLVHKNTGQLFMLRIVTHNFEQTKLAQVLAHSFAKIGVKSFVRQLDPTHYSACIKDRSQYDLAPYVWGHTLSPGAEQQLYWHSHAAIQPNSRNYASIRDPNVDFLSEYLLKVQTRQELIACLNALDRVLRQGHYVIPLFHMTKNFYAFYDFIQTPPFLNAASMPLTEDFYYVPELDSFWIKPSMACSPHQ